MIDYSGYDKETAIKYTRKIDKHNGYTDFLNSVLDIVSSGEIPKTNSPYAHAAKYVLDYLAKKGIEPNKKNFQTIIIRLKGITAAAETFPLHDTASFEEIAHISDSVLEEGLGEELKPWNREFMKKVWEKRKKEK